jgi:hypothetical protein
MGPDSPEDSTRFALAGSTRRSPGTGRPEPRPAPFGCTGNASDRVDTGPAVAALLRAEPPAAKPFMAMRETYRRRLFEPALDQYDYVTTQDADDLGVPPWSCASSTSGVVSSTSARASTGSRTSCPPQGRVHGGGAPRRRRRRSRRRRRACPARPRACKPAPNPCRDAASRPAPAAPVHQGRAARGAAGGTNHPRGNPRDDRGRGDSRLARTADAGAARRGGGRGSPSRADPQGCGAGHNERLRGTSIRCRRGSAMSRTSTRSRSGGSSVRPFCPSFAVDLVARSRSLDLGWAAEHEQVDPLAWVSCRTGDAGWK